ncbi:ribonuclease E activity regulator RraA [Neisseriaceae bacterium PsAf]|nr:ribonuclease E activity regulator RraA [Neisseriaceae bacterium PsAf]
MMILNFETASIIDTAPDTPSCETQFKIYGQRKKFSGPIRTIKCFKDNGIIKKTMNSPSKGEVLVIDGGASYFSALMGDMIAKAGMENGWAGVIINGVIRDSVEINRMHFGIKALGTNPRKSSKEGVGEVDIPVTFGNVTFEPGYYVYSDEDGILVARHPIKEL